MNKLDKKYLVQYIENLNRAIDYLNKISSPIKFNMHYFEDGVPINIVGHLVYSIGGFTREKKGVSFYEYLENATGLMPEEIRVLNKCKSTVIAAEYLENLVFNEYRPKLKRMEAGQ